MDPFSNPHILREMLSRLDGLHGTNELRDTMADLNSMSLARERSSPKDDDIKAQFERIRAQFEKEKGLPPEKVAPMSPTSLILMLREMRKDNINLEGGMSIRSTYSGMPRRSSRKPLDQLQRMSISDMYVRKTHKGQFLLCRTITPPTCTVSVMIGVEDPEGFAVQLAVYNYPGMTDTLHDDLDKLLPIGTILAIREPTYKFSLNGNSKMVRVDAPSDVLFLPDGSIYLQNVSWSSGSNRLPPNIRTSSIDQLLSKGRYEFQHQNWLIAAVFFSEGLRIEPAHAILRLNRAQCYLRIGWYNATLADIEEVRSSGVVLDSSLKIKLSFRAAKAQYMLGNYTQAIEIIETFPENEECTTLVGKARQRLIEQSTGNYDWTGIFNESLKKYSRLDIANFKGPIEMTMNEKVGGGRAISVTRDVPPGELLLVEKPIASCFDNDFKSDVVLTAFDFLTDTMMDRTRVGLVYKVVQCLWDDSKLDNTLKSMYAGPSFSPPCAWGSLSTLSQSLKLVVKQPLESAVDIDITRVEAVCSFNSFSASQNSPMESLPDFGNSGKERTGSAMEDSRQCGSVLYGFPSLINHACQPSAYWSTWGDVIIIRSARAMRRGEEVTIPYVPTNSFEKRTKTLSKWGFDCRCVLCTADAADGISACKGREHREEDFSQVNRADIDSAIRRIKLKIKNIEKTYTTSMAKSSSFVLKPSLLYAHSFLGTLYYEKSGSEKCSNWFHYLSLSIKERMKVLELGGLIILDSSISESPGRSSAQKEGYLPIDTKKSQCHCDQQKLVLNALRLTATFVHTLEDRARGRAWLNVALWICRVQMGGSEDLFKMMYLKIIEQFRLTDLI